MRKREILKNLKKKFEVDVKYFNEYDFEVITDSKSYFVKVLNITENHQITINSKLIWNIKKGKIHGIKFNTVSSVFLNLREFNKLENKIIVLTNKPHKLLRVLNESDLEDVSEEKVINDVFIAYSIDELIEHIK